MAGNNLNEKVIWALSDEARIQVQSMVDMGIDSDLALAVLERLWPEARVYNLPEKEEE